MRQASTSWNYPLRAFFICLAGATLANMDQALFGFVLTPLMEEFGWSIVERGWYLAITFSIAGVTIVGLGTLADRLGRKAVFQGSILVSSLLVTALRWAPGTVSLLVLRTLGFASGGIQSPVTGTIVVEESPPRWRGLLSGVLQIGYPLGWFLASLLAAPIIVRFGWRTVFLVGLLSIPYMFVVGRFLRETKAFESNREENRKAGSESSAAKVRELFSARYRLRTVALFFGELLHVFAYGATILLTSYFVEGRGWELADAIRLVGKTYLIGSFGYILAAVVGELYLTRRTVIIIWSWMGSLFFALLVWGPRGSGQVLLFYSLMTIFFYGTTAVKFTFIAENFPSRLRATGVTLAGSLAVNLGIAFGPLALSYCIEPLGWEWAYTLCGILPIFLSSFFFLLLRPIRRGEEIG